MTPMPPGYQGTVPLITDEEKAELIAYWAARYPDPEPYWFERVFNAIFPSKPKTRP